ncbi:MAG: OadG family protein [Eubacteriales bacterium]|nr:OadG family protein [Eubacteriales bacterium]
MSLMELFANPETILTMSFGDKMLASLVTMIMGIGITFVILILIWIFISVQGRLMGSTVEKKNEVSAVVPVPSAGQVTAASDDSLVAVIAAAVAAYTGGNASNLVVRKIQRISGENTPWGVSALEDRLETRKF